MPTAIPPSGKPLISSEQISSRIATLGQQISADLAGEKETVLLTVADGALIFSADLSRAVSIPIYMDQIAVSSYEGTASSGKINLRTEPRLDLTGKNILLVDDILDTGRTISYLISYLVQFNPNRIYICVMLDKPSGRKVPVRADYVGFEVPDKFVIGYGMDYDGLYRNLPAIYSLD